MKLSHGRNLLKTSLTKMRIDQGKSAKHMGCTSPSVARRIDHDPAKPTAKATGKHTRKRFGFVVEYANRKSDKWFCGPFHQWYDTADKRNQAMLDWDKKAIQGYRKGFYLPARIIDR